MGNSVSSQKPMTPDIDSDRHISKHIYDKRNGYQADETQIIHIENEGEVVGQSEGKSSLYNTMK